MYVLIVVFSFFVGIVSGLLGVGGGILIVPFLIFLCRYPTKNSTGVVSFIVIFSSLFGIFGHLTSGGFDSSLDRWLCSCSLCRSNDRCEKHSHYPRQVHQGGLRGNPPDICDSGSSEADAYFLTIHDI